MKFTKIKTIFLLFLFINLIPFFCLAATADNSYKPMEGIPGIIQPNQAVDFPTYLMAIYKFGLWAIGVSAMFMIMIGGYMYLTSAGNNSQTGKAKGVITDAIAGLVLALVSYVLLWTINPDLVKFKPLQGLLSTTSSTTTGTSNGNTLSNNKAYGKACPNTTSRTPIDFSRATSDSEIKLDSNCDKFNFSNEYGVSEKILRTIAQIESSCGTNKGKSKADCCGLMQLDPQTAGASCNELINDDAKSIRLAAKYISDNQSRHKGNVQNILAGYNSGYATGSSSSGGLGDSKDCPGSLKYQCCYDPQELDETIGYVWNGTGLMSK